jgi:hypothetical protein
MKRVYAIPVIFALLIAAGLYRDVHGQAGGFPSLPQFASIGVQRAAAPPFNGGASITMTPLQTGGSAYAQVNDTTTGQGIFCTSDTASNCATGSVAHDLTIGSALPIDLFVNATLRETITSTGIQTVGNFGVGVSPSGTNTVNLPSTTNANNADWYLIGGSPIFATSRMAFNGAGTPTAVACNHCGTFSVTRNSVGNYTITHNAGLANGSYTVCGRAGSGTAGTAFTIVTFAEGSNSFQILVFNSTPSLADPANTEAVVCTSYS